jgi:hypothetical protein
MHKKLIKYFFKKNHIDHTKKELVDVKKNAIILFKNKIKIT